jgi:hypothetical protein
MGIANGFGGVLHFARTSFSPGFCQLCKLLPRGSNVEGLCAETKLAASARTSDLT